MSEEIIPFREDMLSTGSTLLNLACSEDPFGGFKTGHYYLLVGDSDSGKTFFSMTCMAEATLNPAFTNYRFIYDNAEDGMLMDLDVLFNETVADRIEPPSGTAAKPIMSTTIQEFYYHLDDAAADGRPFIYILDSMDGIDSDSSEKKFKEQKRAARKKQAREMGEDGGGEEKKVKGSYGDGKAKENSQNLRRFLKHLKRTGSILIIISQTRDNLDGYEKISSGGRALKFYATMQIWTTILKKLKKTVNDKDRDIGSRIGIQIKRNRLTGKRTQVEVDIFPSFGIDDIGTCVDYLVEEGTWHIKGLTIDAAGTGISGTREKVIRQIEKRGLETQVRSLCGVCWAEIAAAIAIKRKNRYALAAE